MMMGESSHFVTDAVVGDWRHNEPMARHVSWKAGGVARRTFTPASLKALSDVLPTLPADEPIAFVGLGSNLLVRDAGFPGTIIFTHRALNGLILLDTVGPDGGEGGTVFAAAGVPSPHLAKFAANHDLGGAEWLAGVPGTVGGALAMNAGCYGGETWNHILRCQTIDRDGTVRIRTPQDFRVGYRHVAPARARALEWFTAAEFRFGKGNKEASRERIKELLAQRVASQPLSQPNAGSVFRNPPGDYAARLIEMCGLKGYQIGGAEVSRKHANFIVNTGGASAKDIESIIDHIEATVLAQTGIALHREVRIIGGVA